MTPVSCLFCRDALRRLDDYLDRTLLPEELRHVEAHLKDCLHCAEIFQFEATLIEGIRGHLRCLSLPPALLHTIKLRLRGEAGSPRFDA